MNSLMQRLLGIDEAELGSKIADQLLPELSKRSNRDISHKLLNQAEVEAIIERTMGEITQNVNIELHMHVTLNYADGYNAVACSDSRNPKSANYGLW